MRLNREDFIQYWRTRDGMDQGWRAGVFLMVYLAGMLLFVIPIRLVEANPVWAWLWFPSFFLYLIVMPLVWRRVMGQRLRSEFERCPNCKCRMLGANHLVAVATNNCGACGETILQ